MGRTYAGPGATIGPALVFGYLAAEDIAAPDGRSGGGLETGASAPSSTSEAGGAA